MIITIFMDGMRSIFDERRKITDYIADILIN